MGLLAAVAQLNTDDTALDADQAALVAAQQAVISAQAGVTTGQGAITTDDAAVVAALTAGPNPAFTGPDSTGSIMVYTLDPAAPAGFDVVKVSPAN